MPLPNDDRWYEDDIDIDVDDNDDNDQDELTDEDFELLYQMEQEGAFV